jgi:hypothetical protein
MVSPTKLGVLKCYKCENFTLAVRIPFNKETMDKFEKHTEACSGIPAKISKNDNITLGYN